eukprot:TRINITY_DN380_c2_g1_i1.p1 TRINITY_DN380_c2_g1~~TRINITY_DN380_c2_g1_i1.p1  ORF type:complete len:815 (+),score=293.40 TRINITY_DN380_c2_g1_i1:305-2446(+)
MKDEAALAEKSTATLKKEKAALLTLVGQLCGQWDRLEVALLPLDRLGANPKQAAEAAAVPQSVQGSLTQLLQADSGLLGEVVPKLKAVLESRLATTEDAVAKLLNWHAVFLTASVEAVHQEDDDRRQQHAAESAQRAVEQYCARIKKQAEDITALQDELVQEKDRAATLARELEQSEEARKRAEKAAARKAEGTAPQLVTQNSPQAQTQTVLPPAVASPTAMVTALSPQHSPQPASQGDTESLREHLQQATVSSDRWRARAEQLQAELDQVKLQLQQTKTELEFLPEGRVTSHHVYESLHKAYMLLQKQLQESAAVLDRTRIEARAEKESFMNMRNEELRSTQKCHADAEEQLKVLQEETCNLKEKIAGLDREVELLKQEPPAASNTYEELQQLLQVKSDELAKEQNTVKGLRAEVENARRALEAHIAELAMIPPQQLQQAGEQLRRLEKANCELTHQLDTQRQEAAAVMVEFEETCKSFEQMQVQNTRLLATIRQKEDLAGALLTARFASEKRYAVLKTGIESVKRRTEQETALLERSKTELAGKEATIQNQFLALAEKEHYAADLLANLEKTRIACQDFSMAVTQARKEGEFLRQNVTETQQKLTEAEQGLIAERNTVQKLEAEREVLKKKAEARKPVNNALLKDLEDELAQIKSKLRCTLCNDREKNTIISRCYHVFCEQCINTSLQLRQRKCPGCHMSFGKGDVHRIWL